jgi:hypothetical protein
MESNCAAVRSMMAAFKPSIYKQAKCNMRRFVFVMSYVEGSVCARAGSRDGLWRKHVNWTAERLQLSTGKIAYHCTALTAS